MSATSCPRDRHILFLSISTITLGLLQILLSLTVISTFQILQKHSTSWPPPHWHPSPATIVRPLNLVPQNLATEQTRVIIACGVLSVGAGIVGCVSSRSGERNSRSTLLVLSNGLVAVTLLASFIYMLLQEDILSFRFRYTDFYSTGQRFTRESWVCQLKDLYTEDEVVNWSMICLEARAGRWLYVPLIGMLSSIAWLSYNNIGKTFSQVRRWSLLKLPQQSMEQKSLELTSGDHSIP